MLLVVPEMRTVDSCPLWQLCSHVNPSQQALPQLPGEMQVRFPPLAAVFLLTDRQMTLLFVCFCLKTPVSYSGPSFSVEDKFQEPQWMPEAADGTKPCICCLSSCTYLPTCDKVHGFPLAHPNGRRHRPCALGP